MWIMSESTITSRGQTTLPAEIRCALRLKSGDKIRYYVLDDGEIRIARVRPVAGLAGILGRGAKPVSLEDMETAIAEGAKGK